MFITCSAFVQTQLNIILTQSLYSILLKCFQNTKAKVKSRIILTPQCKKIVSRNKDNIAKFEAAHGTPQIRKNLAHSHEFWRPHPQV